MRETIHLTGRCEGHDLRDQRSGFVMSTLVKSVEFAVADPKVTEVVLRFDSCPGGVITGIPEAARALLAASRKKAVTAHVIQVCCSGAFWLASSCSIVIAAPNARLGSVGVVQEPEGHFGAGGYFCAAGRLKAAGRPRIPLPADQEAYLQASADREYLQFIQALGAGRGVSRADVLRDFGEGASVGVADALRAGMIDRVAYELDPVEISAPLARHNAAMRDSIAKSLGY